MNYEMKLNDLWREKKLKAFQDKNNKLRGPAYIFKFPRRWKIEKKKAGQIGCFCGKIFILNSCPHTLKTILIIHTIESLSMLWSLCSEILPLEIGVDSCDESDYNHHYLPPAQPTSPHQDPKSKYLVHHLNPAYLCDYAL